MSGRKIGEGILHSQVLFSLHALAGQTVALSPECIVEYEAASAVQFKRIQELKGLEEIKRDNGTVVGRSNEYKKALEKEGQS